MCGVFLRL